MTPEINQAIATLRQKQRDGQLDINDPEDLAALKEALTAMRQGRVSAAIASSKSKAKKAPAPAINSDDLLAELGDFNAD